MKSRLKSSPSGSPLPASASVAKICALLADQFQKEERQTKYAPVKEVLALLGKGAVLSAALLAPKSASFLLPLVKESPDWNAWKRYNVSYLQRTLYRLKKQKQVEVFEENGKQVVRLTNNGKRKVLKYSLDALMVEKPKHWDRKWRLVLYDIPVQEKQLGDIVRDALRSLGFYAIQDSVYLFPYPCFDQVEFLREYYRLGDKVQYMLVEHVEFDDVYKTYFGLS